MLNWAAAEVASRTADGNRGDGAHFSQGQLDTLQRVYNNFQEQQSMNMMGMAAAMQQLRDSMNASRTETGPQIPQAYIDELGEGPFVYFVSSKSITWPCLAQRDRLVWASPMQSW